MTLPAVTFNSKSACHLKIKCVPASLQLQASQCSQNWQGWIVVPENIASAKVQPLQQRQPAFRIHSGDMSLRCSLRSVSLFHKAQNVCNPATKLNMHRGSISQTVTTLLLRY